MRSAMIEISGDVAKFHVTAANSNVVEVVGGYRLLSRLFEYFEQYFGRPIVTKVRGTDIDVDIYEDGEFDENQLASETACELMELVELV